MAHHVRDLPVDVLLEIFTYLDVRSLGAACVTCKDWNEVIDKSESLWKNKSLSSSDKDAKEYILMSRSAGSSWKESYQMNYGGNLIRRKWKHGEFSQPKSMVDLPPNVLCPMTVQTWGEIFEMELER